MKRKHFDIITDLMMLMGSLILLALSFSIVQSSPLGISGARLVPLISTSSMSLLALLRLFVSIFNSDVTLSKIISFKHYLWAAILLLLVAYALALERIGFVVATFGFLLIAIPFFGLRKLFTVIPLSLCIVFGIWLFFTKVLGVYLPSGIF